MAELASGAVNSLLSVIRNEALLLRGVGSDLQFIKEEMESMNSFLAHLARSAPRGGEHDEQVRTWMNQVRFLAQDCNNCIDLYLYRGNPDVQRARGRIRRYLWWVYWYLHKLVAQHQAGTQLRVLKERARDVGERRLRYGVEVPAKSAAARQSPPRSAGRLLPSAQPVAVPEPSCYAAGDDEEDGDDQVGLPYFEPPTLDGYVKKKLMDWRDRTPVLAVETLSMAILAPDTYMHVLHLARETLVFQPDWEPDRTGYHFAMMVDISALHHPYLPLRPKEVLYYILRNLRLEHSKSQEQRTDQGEGKEKDLDSLEVIRSQFNIYMQKKQEFHKIKETIKQMKVCEKLDIIKTDIQDLQNKGKQMLQQELNQNSLEANLQLLFLPSSVISQEDQFKNEEALDDHSIAKIAKMLKERMEEDEKGMQLKEQGGGEGGRGEKRGGGGGSGEGEGEKGAGEAGVGGQGEPEIEIEEEEEEDHDRSQTAPIQLHEAQYACILRKVFPLLDQQQERTATNQDTNITLDKDQVKQMIHEAKQEILQELKESRYDKNQEAGQGEYEMNQGTDESKYNKKPQTGQPQAPDTNIEEDFKRQVNQKMDRIKTNFKEQFKIKWLINEIKHLLRNRCPLFILKVDNMMDVFSWEDTRNALSLLELSADVLIVTTKDAQEAKGYCYPQLEPIDYSLVGLFHYTMLKLDCTSHPNEHNYNPQIIRDILNECGSHEFCMKIFTYALYANPKRSIEELKKLKITLHDSPNKSFDTIATKMLKFSYSDLPKEYKSCLLYLAIFPQGHVIKRSTLIARWVVEGLIFKEDWPSSVSQANRCFDTLINRWLVNPVSIGATDKVKSCVVGNTVHRFITNIARKQHIVEPRLSHHMARHFSVFNDLHIRSSEGIQNFFQRLSKSSGVSLLKVLDLESCHCFGGNNQRYLKEICRKMLLLKYLSLRGTNITQLPREINHLRELELLDIRQTEVPEYATRHVLLLKLKRFLVGHIDSNLSSFNNGTAMGGRKSVSTVRIPHKIGKMVNLEVLSNVKAQNSHDLKDIGKLCYLRKLGVVINDNNSHLRKLLEAISDLHQCLLSLSITITQEDAHTRKELQDDITSYLKNYPNSLESLSITGKAYLLPLFANPDNDKLAKVTLSSTLLTQNEIMALAKLPKLHCVQLRHIACTESRMSIKEGDFKHLKYLLVQGSNLTEIKFEEGAAPELKKMVLSFTNIESVSGVWNLQNLEELEFNGDTIPDEVKEAIKRCKNPPTLKHNKPEIRN